jgi:hypothetical protein
MRSLHGMRGRVRDGCSVQTRIGRVTPDVHTFVRRAEAMGCDHRASRAD